MGWSRGSEVADGVIRGVNEITVALGYYQRFELYLKIIPVLWDMDWDTEEEVRGIDPAFDNALDCLNNLRDADHVNVD